MTVKPEPTDGKYKQLYKKSCEPRPYTQARIGHDDYIHTNEWRRLRNERLKIDRFQCCFCGTGINLEIHHLRYPGIWGMESVEDDLVTLCRQCHELVHKFDTTSEQASTATNTSF